VIPVVLTLLIAAFIGGCTIGVFLTLVVGIHIEEHRTARAHHDTCAEIAARQVMGVYIRKPADSVDADQARR
jgi:hypothetical protein